MVQQFKGMKVSANCLEGDFVRRLSTISTVACKSRQGSSYLEPYCIEWQWYWKDEHEKWIQYAQQVRDKRVAIHYTLTQMFFDILYQ